MRLALLLAAVLVAGCVAGPEPPAPTTTTIAAPVHTLESSLAAAREYVKNLPVNASCTPPAYEDSYPASCDSCWLFTFLYRCADRTDSRNGSVLARLNVTVGEGAVSGAANSALGTVCNLDGDCIPDRPQYNVRYLCSDGICAQAQFSDEASEYCRQRGNRLIMGRLPSGGEYTLCKFVNGNECEEWAYYYRNCGPDTGNLTDCSDYSSMMICNSDYRPVCAKIASKSNGTDVYTWSDYGNGCLACLSQNAQMSTLGYRMGICPPTTTTLKASVISNAEAAFCEKRGYVYRTRKYPSGREYGVCVFGIEDECNAADFFKGLCGPKHLGD